MIWCSQRPPFGDSWSFACSFTGVRRAPITQAELGIAEQRVIDAHRANALVGIGQIGVVRVSARGDIPEGDRVAIIDAQSQGRIRAENGLRSSALGGTHAADVELATGDI